MATISYLLQSKSKNSQIYIRLSVNRQINFKKKTGFTIDSNNWSDKTNLPKQNTAENKSLIIKLNQLSNYVFDCLNNDLSNDVLIDSNWLSNCIDECFNRVKITDDTVLLNFVNTFISNAHTREIRGGKIGLSKGTIKNYNSFKRLIEQYQKHIKKIIQFSDLNKTFTDKFKNWLFDNGYSVNYVGKQFATLKSICKEAQKNDINVTINSITLGTIKEQDKDKIIHTLSFDEIEKIYNTEMPTPHLKEIKKWILIGCYIGQRGGDLVNLKPENIRQTSKGLYIDVIQQKTDKNVTIGVSKDYIIDILLNDFPKPVSQYKMNKHIAEVCKLAGINEVVEGNKIDVETGKRITVKDFKYNFITSHCLRRSFATNFYKKIPTPVLISITGHKTEQMFLNYINQREDKDANADLFMSYFEQMNANVTPQLKVVKNI